MSALALHLETYLPRDRRASVHTCEAFAYAFQLLVSFAAKRLHQQPSVLEIEQLDAPLILAFLEHIETERHNLPQTRNARLVAIKAFFRFLEYRLPCCLEQARRIHAIPVKKTDETVIDYLTRDEMQTLLDMPDPRTADGLRDRAMIHLAFAGGYVCLAREAGVAEPALETRVASLKLHAANRRSVRSGNPAIRDAAAGAAASEDRRLCVAVFRRVCPYSTGVIVLEAGPVNYRAGPHESLANAGNTLEANQQRLPGLRNPSAGTAVG